MKAKVTKTTKLMPTVTTRKTLVNDAGVEFATFTAVQTPSSNRVSIIRKNGKIYAENQEAVVAAYQAFCDGINNSPVEATTDTEESEEEL